MNKGQILILSIIVLLSDVIFVGRIVNAATCIGGGTLSITSIPGTSNFAAQNTSLTSVLSTLVFGSSLNFEDMRNTVNGFSLTITSTDFQDITNTDNTFSLSNLAFKSDDNDTIGLVDCDSSVGITLNWTSYSAFADADLDGISDAKTILSGDVRARIGKYSIEPELQLTMPAYTPSGTFRTTLTISIQ